VKELSSLNKIIVFLFVGFLAQLIDGSLGMAYGSTTTSLLLAYGVAPAVASSSVHFAEVVTTGISGISHYKLGNVDQRIVMRLVIPGIAGSLIGVFFIVNAPVQIIRPLVSVFLIILSLIIIFRFLKKKVHFKKDSRHLGVKVLLLGFLAGLVDSTGGGWGQIATPSLMTQQDLEPRRIIGSVDTSEFFITIASSAGFLYALGTQNINWTWVLVLMGGGIIAAPITAYLVKIMPSKQLGILVGILLLITNVRLLLSILKTGHLTETAVYILLWVFIISISARYLFKK
jgi:uncharacterized membrane protein YfcA